MAGTVFSLTHTGRMWNMSREQMLGIAMILDFASGVLSVGIGVLMVPLILVSSAMDPNVRSLFYIPILLIVVGALSFTGGIYIQKRKKWYIAVAGSIAALCPPLLAGIAAIIFTIRSKKQFI